MRTVAIVTTSRADYGIYRPVLRAVQSAAGLRPSLWVSGSHLSPEFGLTAQDIEADGFEIAERIEIALDSDTPEATTRAMAVALEGFGSCVARIRPDIVIVLGDRFEMHSAALAALPFRVPVAHIHGGEISQGAFDDALRHSITKLSHLHFVSTHEHARRVMQMGEEQWRVTVCGAPSLDNLRVVQLRPRAEIERLFGLGRGEPFLLVTFHPATLDAGDPADQVRALLDAIETHGCAGVITMPNADPGGRAIRAVIQERAALNTRLTVVEHLGTDVYFSAMATAAAMAGNSSSGLIESASFGLPVLNVGSRQQGRVHGRNVIHVAATREAIIGGLAQVLDPAFRAALRGTENPYGDGHASERIVERLQDVALGSSLVVKRFVDAPDAQLAGHA